MGVELLLIIRARAYQSLLEDNVVIVSAPFFFGAYGNTQMKKQKIMDDPTCSYPCLMKLDYRTPPTNLPFLKTIGLALDKLKALINYQNMNLNVLSVSLMSSLMSS